MFTKRTINTLIAGSLLATPAFFMAMEPSRQGSIWKDLYKVINEFTVSLQANDKTLVSKESHQIIANLKAKLSDPLTNLTQEEQAAICLRAVCAPMTAWIALCAAKEFSKTTWSHILSHKKAALCKYMFSGSATALLGMITYTALNNIDFSNPWIDAGVTAYMLLLTGGSGITTCKHLNNVLEAPATSTAPATSAASVPA